MGGKIDGWGDVGRREEGKEKEGEEMEIGGGRERVFRRRSE